MWVMLRSSNSQKLEELVKIKNNFRKDGQAGAARHPANTWVPYTNGIGGEKFPELGLEATYKT